MKVIIVGSTDVLGAELVKQALDNIEITSIIAISDAPQEPSADSKMVTCQLPDSKYGWEQLNFDAYAATACIWNIKPVMELPSHRNAYLDQVQYLNETRSGVEWIARRRGAHTGNPESPGELIPLRFIYVSTSQAKKLSRPNQRPTALSIQRLAEDKVLASPSVVSGRVQACIAKPGRIVRHKTGNVLKEMVHTAGSWVRDGLTGRLPRIQVEKVAAALLDRAITGQHAETLYNRDLIRIGEEALKDPEDSETGKKAKQTSRQAGETGKQAEQTVQDV
ncbi:hypothetical protein EAE96_001178 [Botrytis aclada]|nr:hypothetical protein EAE96_001178 [Botrytis aclada]